jgi:hypothetical protein
MYCWLLRMSVVCCWFVFWGSMHFGKWIGLWSCAMSELLASGVVAKLSILLFELVPFVVAIVKCTDVWPLNVSDLWYVMAMGPLHIFIIYLMLCLIVFVMVSYDYLWQFGCVHLNLNLNILVINSNLNIFTKKSNLSNGPILHCNLG